MKELGLVREDEEEEEMSWSELWRVQSSEK